MNEKLKEAREMYVKGELQKPLGLLLEWAESDRLRLDSRVLAGLQSFSVMVEAHSHGDPSVLVDAVGVRYVPESRATAAEHDRDAALEAKCARAVERDDLRAKLAEAEPVVEAAKAARKRRLYPLDYAVDECGQLYISSVCDGDAADCYVEDLELWCAVDALTAQPDAGEPPTPCPNCGNILGHSLMNCHESPDPEPPREAPRTGMIEWRHDSAAGTYGWFLDGEQLIPLSALTTERAAHEETKRELAVVQSTERHIRKGYHEAHDRLTTATVELSAAQARMRTLEKREAPEDAWHRCAVFFMGSKGERWLKEHQCNGLTPRYEPLTAASGGKEAK